MTLAARAASLQYIVLPGSGSCLVRDITSKIFHHTGRMAEPVHTIDTQHGDTVVRAAASLLLSDSRSFMPQVSFAARRSI